jgi:peptidoglycan/xylan/chitin deacetylase (PgdA/CDA1 family)
VDRRTLLSLFALGLADVLTGCTGQGGADPIATTAAMPAHPRDGHHRAHVAREQAQLTDWSTREPQIIRHGEPGTDKVALTIDDGYSAETVAAYVEFARRTGIALTFSPNGMYQRVWTPHAATLRPLIEAGQVQIGNHTYHHAYLTRLSDVRVTAEIEQNEDWIQRTFHTTARPWFRPPYGARDERTDALAAASGFDHVLLWNGSLGDSRLLTPRVLLQQAEKYLRAGAVVLGHANHPTVTYLFDALVALIRDRGLTPVTLDAMFGLHRPRPEPPFRVPVPAWTLTAPTTPPPLRSAPATSSARATAPAPATARERRGAPSHAAHVSEARPTPAP